MSPWAACCLLCLSRSWFSSLVFSLLLRDETMVTLVEDYYQEAVPQGITYDQIIIAIKGDTGGHIKSDGGAANAVRPPYWFVCLFVCIRCRP